MEDGLFLPNGERIADLAIKNRMPSIGPREFCEAGGLLAYGVDFPFIWRQGAVLVDKIFKGAKPVDLPIQSATRFEFVVNLKTARALGLPLPFRGAGPGGSGNLGVSRMPGVAETAPAGGRMTGLLVIDMQAGLFVPESPRHDTDGVVDRINDLARAVRRTGGVVVFVQHDGPTGDPFEPGADGWRLLPSLDRGAGDVVVHKTACDAFYGTELAEVLDQRGTTQLIVTGCATDFCVDTTIRAAASRD